jgi:hypothetical protein
MSTKIAGLALTVGLLAATAVFAGSVRADGGVTHSSTGAGNFFTTSGFLRTFAFSAIEYGDGSVSGEAEVRNPALGTLRHFRIDCLSIRDGNLAIASGTVTSAEDPNLVGESAIFVAQDNSQGADSAPDQVSDGVYLNRPFNCHTAPTTLALSVLVPIDAGNIQIR